MKKSIAVLLISAILVFSLLPGAGLAYNEGASRPDAAPYSCTVSVSGVQNSLNRLYLEIMVSAANAKIASLVRYAQLTPYNDVDWLLREVEATVAPVFSFAAAIGATVVCEYVGYTIDGQYVLVDPIHVVRG